MKKLFIQFYLLLFVCFLVMSLLVGLVYKVTPANWVVLASRLAGRYGITSRNLPLPDTTRTMVKSPRLCYKISML